MLKYTRQQLRQLQLAEVLDEAASTMLVRADELRKQVMAERPLADRLIYHPSLCCGCCARLAYDPDALEQAKRDPHGLYLATIKPAWACSGVLLGTATGDWPKHIESADLSWWKPERKSKAATVASPASVDRIPA
jgi:hypothetical protein